MNLSMKDRVAVVTGGNKGIGIAVARRFAESGASVAILARGAADLKLARETLAKDGLVVRDYVCDVSKAEAITKAHHQIVADFGKIDVLVNNAAINPPSLTILQDTLANWRRTIEINLEAVFMGSKLVAPHMAERRQGRIIHIASIQGFASSGEVGSYNAAKGGILALTKSMAVELGPYNILVNAVAPGFMLTPMSIVNGVNETETPDFIEWYVKKGKVPLRRTGHPEDVSGTVIFLASSYCRYMTGQLLVVDGGLMSTF